jgi:hypothetical protein
VLNDEALGDPGIPIAEGSGIVIAGVGLVNGPGSIVIDVPGTVQQALLYWSGQHRGPSGDDAITADFDGDVQALVGTLIGGPRVFFFNMGAVSLSTYRADVTAFVQSGLNTIAISDMAFDDRSLGAGLLVIFDDGTTSDVQLRDGQDLAFLNFAPPLDATVPQTFDFDPADSDRIGNLNLFACDVEDGRPNTIRVTVDGTVTDFPNELDSMDGPDWDSVILDVDIPAGISSLTVEVISGDGLEQGEPPASLNWLAAGLSVPEDIGTVGTGCTPGYWKTATPQDRDYSHWPAPYEPDDALSSVFNIPACVTDANIQNGTLLSALQGGGGGGVNGGARILLRAAVAGVLNAQLTDNGCGDYPSALSDLVDDVNDALASCDRAEMLTLAGEIDEDNNLGCPQNAHGECQD